MGLHTPRLFTKLLKPITGYTRRQNHIVLAYLGDILIIGNLEAAELAVSALWTFFSKWGSLPIQINQRPALHRLRVIWGSRWIPIT